MPVPDWAQKNLCIIVPNQRTASPEFFSCVRTRRLLSRHTCLVRSSRLCVYTERLSETNVHATIPKGNMGYEQYTVPDSAAVKPTFVAFL